MYPYLGWLSSAAFQSSLCLLSTGYAHSVVQLWNVESVPAHWGALKVFLQSFPRFLLAAFFLSGQLKVETFFLAHWNWLLNAISPLPSETFRHILWSGFFSWCLVATPCRIMWVQGNKRDAVWLGLSLFKWLCIMFKSFGRSAVLVPVRLPPFGGSLVESFLVPAPPWLMQCLLSGNYNNDSVKEQPKQVST